MFKRIRCDHHFHKVGTREVSTGNMIFDLTTYTVLYCPRCKQEKLVEESEWEIMQEKQYLDQKYMRSDCVDY